MKYVGLDVHLHTSTLHILNRHGGDVQTITLKGHWQETIRWLKDRRRVFSICYEASTGYGPVHDALAKIARRVVIAGHRSCETGMHSVRMPQPVGILEYAKGTSA